jgi:small nuclear ribonucleoprotein (snRNP)-like protein
LMNLVLDDVKEVTTGKIPQDDFETSCS